MRSKSAVVLVVLCLLALVALLSIPGVARASVVTGLGQGQWLSGYGVPVCYPTSDPAGAPSVGGGMINGAPHFHECVELAQRLYGPNRQINGVWTHGLGWYKGSVDGVFRVNGAAIQHAYDIYDKAGSLGMQPHKNGSGYSPVPGDLIVHGTTPRSGFGHVAVVDRVSGTTVYAVEQNVSTNPGCRATYTLTGSTLKRVGSSLFTPVLGVVHDTDNHVPPSTALAIDGATASGTVSPAGDADWYTFTVKERSTYMIQTYAGTLTDSYIYLYGPNSRTKYIWENDDINVNTNRMSRITWNLGPGTYYVKARGYSNYTGTYRIGVQTQTTKLYYLNDRATRTLSPAGDTDWYSFTVGEMLWEGTWLVIIRIWDPALADYQLDVYGPNSRKTHMFGVSSTDPDQGSGGYRIFCGDLFTPGTYYVKVRAISRSATPTYTIETDHKA